MMRILWTYRRKYVIAISSLVALAAISGGLFVAALVGVQSWVGLLGVVAITAPVLALFTLSLALNRSYASRGGWGYTTSGESVHCFSDTNPTTGLPMVAGGVDTSGTPWGDVPR